MPSWDTAKFIQMSEADVIDCTFNDAGSMSFPHRSFIVPANGCWWDSNFDYTMKGCTITNSTAIGIFNEIGDTFTIENNIVNGTNSDAIQYFEVAIYNSTSSNGVMKNNNITPGAGATSVIRIGRGNRGSDPRFGLRTSENFAYENNTVNLENNSIEFVFLVYTLSNSLAPNNYLQWTGKNQVIRNNIYNNGANGDWSILNSNSNPYTETKYNLAQFQALTDSNSAPFNLGTRHPCKLIFNQKKNKLWLYLYLRHHLHSIL